MFSVIPKSQQKSFCSFFVQKCSYLIFLILKIIKEASVFLFLFQPYSKQRILFSFRPIMFLLWPIIILEIYMNEDKSIEKIRNIFCLIFSQGGPKILRAPRAHMTNFALCAKFLFLWLKSSIRPCQLLRLTCLNQAGKMGHHLLIFFSCPNDVHSEPADRGSTGDRSHPRMRNRGQP